MQGGDALLQIYFKAWGGGGGENFRLLFIHLSLIRLIQTHLTDLGSFKLF